MKTGFENFQKAGDQNWTTDNGRRSLQILTKSSFVSSLGGGRVAAMASLPLPGLGEADNADEQMQSNTYHVLADDVMVFET